MLAKLSSKTFRPLEKDEQTIEMGWKLSFRGESLVYNVISIWRVRFEEAVKGPKGRAE